MAMTPISGWTTSWNDVMQVQKTVILFQDCLVLTFCKVFFANFSRKSSYSTWCPCCLNRNDTKWSEDFVILPQCLTPPPPPVPPFTLDIKGPCKCPKHDDAAKLNVLLCKCPFYKNNGNFESCIFPLKITNALIPGIKTHPLCDHFNLQCNRRISQLTH